MKFGIFYEYQLPLSWNEGDEVSPKATVNQ